MIWYPKSFFGRLLGMVLLAVLFSKALTLIYLLLNDDVLVDRQYSLGAALTLRAYWAAPASEQASIAEAAGLRQVTEKDVPLGERQWPYSDIFIEQMRAELGNDTRVRISAETPPSLYVSAPSLGDGWLRIPLYPHPLRGQRLLNLFGWFLGIGLLSTAATWVFVRQFSAPLKRLVVVARQFGSGHSVRLPVNDDTASEMAEVYHAFNQMTADIEQANRERELMLAGISHDLRTPLTRMRLSLALLGDDSELARDMVQDIEDMDAILEQFLAFIRDGRDEAGELCDLAGLVREVVQPYVQQGQVTAGGLQYIPCIRLRRLSFKRMLTNLVENAIRYGGTDVRISLELARHDKRQHALLCVQDSGPGIAEADLPGIFKPFTRGDQARGGQGAGLGLAIVQRIVTLHEGHIELEHPPTGGLRVKVWLPLEKQQGRPKFIKFQAPARWKRNGNRQGTH